MTIDSERRAALDKALTAVCEALTGDQLAAILQRYAPEGSLLYGAHIDDLVETAWDSDALCSVTDPFFEDHQGELPDVPGLHYAAYALAMAGEQLTVPGVLELLWRAQLACPECLAVLPSHGPDCSQTLRADIDAFFQRGAVTHAETAAQGERGYYRDHSGAWKPYPPGWRLECPECGELDGVHKRGCEATAVPRQLKNIPPTA